MRPRLALLVLTIAALPETAGCKRQPARGLDAVQALSTAVQPGFHAPPDGLLTDAQIETFLRVRGRAQAEPEAQALRTAGVDPAEFAWVRARVLEAMLALDAARATNAAAESYARALAVTREVRRSARDAKTIARLDAEIAGLERERASLNKGNPLPPPVLRNATRLAPRRAEIEATRP